ncbi:bifunctional phosphoribosyl-AMP cyclohydrolase/phosphoribosyl-ATP diphosphatase HisIE [Romboutsia sp.]|uniref:bifunctional phosphoribosyl-AMP cyclohydrolase/phosphoribosyl-ATP diphosphatase HisIE n=1 Tax=Romboutsia sp. TaxID=1965302 RepID=UPI002BA06AB3|nr:bifunctional phosphoribosyl-AMP cyclohydrolase/phosphoribosyl-ATP diphosphatase HisIE [Romboutsia sp.]HSQ89511.1 bifunctional phosphoribosyl-AMP cyclohydrolase/phosphoribosyl-ATP diphosphatase HisIE [Romboutsia sp.]
MDINKLIEGIKFDENGLVPAIVQDINTNKVLMLAYMNEESIRKTVEEKIACYYSRSRKELWKKGETSGNIQKLKGFYYDCDKDSILLLVEQIGVACHTGNYSCFFNEVIGYDNQVNVLTDLYELIENRKNTPVEGSYTNYLFEKGLDKILKKVGEETSEVIIGAKNKDKEEMVYEISDLVYHLLVLMVNEGVSVNDIKEELKNRTNK